jgi:cation transport ATPase
MIQIALFLPLAIGGVAGALWRERHRNKAYITFSPDLSTLSLPTGEKDTTQAIGKKVTLTDDAVEISHNQRVALIALALSGSGRLVFPLFTLASIPFLSYSTYNFLTTIHRSNPQRKKSAITIFELASVAGAIITGRYLLLASLLTLSFSIRKWGLQAGNISSIGMARAFNPNYTRVWVLRGESELEVTLSELQPDDIVVLHAGDIIRKDGEVVGGEGVVKQFSLAGILQAIPKHIGDSVFSYTEVSAGDLQIKYS